MKQSDLWAPLLSLGSFVLVLFPPILPLQRNMALVRLFGIGGGGGGGDPPSANLPCWGAVVAINFRLSDTSAFAPDAKVNTKVSLLLLVPYL